MYIMKSNVALGMDLVALQSQNWLNFRLSTQFDSKKTNNLFNTSIVRKTQKAKIAKPKELKTRIDHFLFQRSQYATGSRRIAANDGKVAIDNSAILRIKDYVSVHTCLTHIFGRYEGGQVGKRYLDHFKFAT